MWEILRGLSTCCVDVLADTDHKGNYPQCTVAMVTSSEWEFLSLISIWQHVKIHTFICNRTSVMKTPLKWSEINVVFICFKGFKT